MMMQLKKWRTSGSVPGEQSVSIFNSDDGLLLTPNIVCSVCAENHNKTSRGRCTHLYECKSKMSKNV